MSSSSLPEYKEFPIKDRFVAQLTRDFMDMGKPGEIDIVVHDDHIQRVRVTLFSDPDVDPDVDLDDALTEPEDFSPEFRLRQMETIQLKRPSYADIEQGVDDDD